MSASDQNAKPELAIKPVGVAAARQNPILKLVLELGPLALFFVANLKPKLFEPLVAPFVPAQLLTGERAGIFTGTPVLMVAVVVALVASYWTTRKLPTMPLVTAFFVVVLGAMTLIFQDDVFIKMKPTIVNAIFGAALLGGLAFGRSLLPIALDNVMNLTEEGWRKLTLNWGLFFFVLAALNEIVWRTQTTEFWAGFKVFGTFPLTMIFALSQVPIVLKYEKKEEEAEAAGATPKQHW